MKKIPIALATLTIVSSLGMAMMPMSAMALKTVSVTDIGSEDIERPFEFTRIDYAAGTVKLQFNTEDNPNLKFKGIIFSDFVFEKYDLNVAASRLAEIHDTEKPEWSLNVVREPSEATAGIFEKEYQIDKVMKGQGIHLGTFLYAIEYTDSSSGVEETKWLDGMFDYSSCSWGWISEEEFLATPCTIRRMKPNGPWWLLTQENAIEGKAQAWGKRLGYYIENKLVEIDGKLNDEEAVLTKEEWNNYAALVMGFKGPIDGTARFFDTSLESHRQRTYALLLQNEPKEEKEPEKEDGNTGNTDNPGNEENESGDGQLGNTGAEEKPADLTVVPRPGVLSGNKVDDVIDKNQNDSSTEKPTNSANVIIHNANITDKANDANSGASGTIIATKVTKMTSGQSEVAVSKEADSGNTSGSTQDSEEEEQKNDQESVLANNAQADKKIVVPALNNDSTEIKEERVGLNLWWLLLPIVLVSGGLIAWWVKRAFGEGDYGRK